MPVWLVAIATLLGSAIIADLPPTSQTNADDVLVFDAPAFAGQFGTQQARDHLLEGLKKAGFH